MVDYVAEQLGLQAADLKGHGEKEARWDHQEQIRSSYGYTAFAGEQWFALACWLYKRAWTTGERPIVLFDLATHRPMEANILLPGVTTLERLIAALRERVASRQYALLAAAPSPNQAAVLEELVKVESGRRVSRLDRLRKAPPTSAAPAWSRPWIGTWNCATWAQPAPFLAIRSSAGRREGPVPDRMVQLRDAGQTSACA